MAFLGLQVPHQIARLLAQADYGDKGEPESTDTYHITGVYFGDELSIEEIAKIIVSAYKVTSRTKPFTVETSRVTTFPPHPEHGTVPIICRVDSEELHSLREALLQQFDEDGVGYDQKFPEFKPHVTLAYVKDEKDFKLDMAIPTIEWGVGELVLWGGDSGDDKLVVTFPFALAPAKAALYRAMVHIALSRPSS
jgi:2'-5' RNA ligase